MGNILKKSKFLIFLLITVIILTVVFYSQNQKSIEIVQAQGVNGILRVHPTNTRYFTNDSGEAIYLNGVDNFRALQDWNSNGLGVFDYQAFLDYLQSHNYNYLRMWMWDHFYTVDGDNEFNIFPPHIYKRTGPGTAIDGLPKFDLYQLDQDYFDRLRSRVIDAREHGMYVSIMLFQGFSTGSFGWTGHPFNIDNNINGIDGDADNNGEGHEIHTRYNTEINNIQDDYVRKVIDTVYDLDNVLYEIANEPYANDAYDMITADSVANWHYHFIDFIHEYEQNTYGVQHPVGISHIRIQGENDNPYLFNSSTDWVSPSWANRLWQTNPPIADGSVVIIADTDHIHPDQNPDIGYHTWLWMCLTRGHSVNAVDGSGEGEDDYFSAEDSRVMADTARYANKMDLAAMVPSDSSNDCSTTFCLRNPGQEYLVYQPDTGSFNVNLVEGEYDLEWFNPSLGTIVEQKTLIVATSGNKSFTPPSSIAEDSVLYIHKAESSQNTIPNDSWTLLHVDSEEITEENGAAINAFDGDVNTIWHTEWSNLTPSHPHEIQIDLGSACSLEGFSYLPRQDGINGRISDYEFYISLDGENWGTAVKTGTFVNDYTRKNISFSARPGRYIRLKAINEVNNEAWTTVAEIGVYGYYCLRPDFNCNDLIDTTDLTNLISNWGTLNSDFNNDSKTDTQDLGIMMSVWGAY